MAHFTRFTDIDAANEEILRLRQERGYMRQSVAMIKAHCEKLKAMKDPVIRKGDAGCPGCTGVAYLRTLRDQRDAARDEIVELHRVYAAAAAEYVQALNKIGMYEFMEGVDE